MYGEVIVIGIVISLLFSEITEISPAGLIVAGYLALNISSPLKLLLTILVAGATFGIYRILSNYLILYGRRRFAIMVLISILISWIISLLPIPVAGISVIGYLIPGIIAKECDRQGILKTSGSLVIVTAITVLVSLLAGISLI